MLFARLVMAATLVAVLAIGSQARADIATEWNALAVEVTAVPPNSILQSRVLAITHLAMYDAARVANQKPALLVGHIQSHEPTSPEAAAVTAAYTVLTRFAPTQAAAVDAVYKSVLVKIVEGAAKVNGIKLGQTVAEKVIEIRATDGSTQKVDVKLSNGLGSYQLTPPHSMQPILAQWGAVRPFAIHLEYGFETKGPSRSDSPQFKADFDEVKQIGARHSTARTADQTAAAVFWTVQTGVPWFAAARMATIASG